MIAVITGASFTALTVKLNAESKVPPAKSFTRKVRMVAPDRFAAGVTMPEQAVGEPRKVTFAEGTRVVFAEIRLRLLAEQARALSISAIVNAIATAVSSLVD